ncbi:MAG: VPLPA-CTERM sorting domain-containing protein [Candidatus Thiodiazotropha sp.]|jgi:hypothetical protein
MKRFKLCTIGLLATVLSSNVFAGAVYDAGTFTQHGDIYSTSPYSGVFTDVVKFDVGTSGLNLRFEGSHSGMAGDSILMTNTSDGMDYKLGSNFMETLNFDAGSYVFTLSGFAMNALDRSIYSNYDLTIQAVPLPAAAWLFGSALLGFISFSARRKI